MYIYKNYNKQPTDKKDKDTDCCGCKLIQIIDTDDEYAIEAFILRTLANKDKISVSNIKVVSTGYYDKYIFGKPFIYIASKYKLNEQAEVVCIE